MRKIHIFFLATAFFMTGCGSNLQPDVTVDESLFKVAKTFDFDYSGTLDKAKAGDDEALKKFVGFHRFADEMDGIHHGVACLELLPFVKDGNFAAACVPLKVGLRRAVLERLIAAQARTKKEELKRPLQEWASATVAMLQSSPITALVTDTINNNPATKASHINLDSLAKAKGVKLEPGKPK